MLPVKNAIVPLEKVTFLVFGFKVPPVFNVKEFMGEKVILLRQLMFPEAPIDITLPVNEPAPDIPDTESILISQDIEFEFIRLGPFKTKSELVPEIVPLFMTAPKASRLNDKEAPQKSVAPFSIVNEP